MPFESSMMNETTKPNPKAPKPRSLPPPGEAFGMDKLPSKKKTKAKATTTKAAPAKKAFAKPKPPAKKSTTTSQAGVSKPVPAKRGRPLKPKAESIYRAELNGSYGGVASLKGEEKKTQSNNIDIDSQVPKKKVWQLGVLTRRTAASQRIRDDMDRVSIIRKPEVHQSNVKVLKKDSGSEKSFRVMDLPKELRTMVWRYAVVNKRAFIWPERQTGHEQPDLVMTSRLVRKEVLPIFYAENIFAINLSPKNEPSYHRGDVAAKGKKQVVLDGGIPVIAEWAAALQAVGKKSDWFSMVRRWAFVYTSRVTRMSDILTGSHIVWTPTDIPTKDFVVAVNFSKRQHGGLFWDAGIEVHYDALCVLPSFDEYGICKVQSVPAWLNGPVITITEDAEGGSISEEMITGLATEIRRKASRVEEVRCEKVLSSGGPRCEYEGMRA